MPIIHTAVKNKQTVYSVSSLNKASRLLLEREFHTIQVEGEISNLVQPASGHYYFKLKDDKAHIQCAFFRNRAQNLNFTPENGQQVLAHARVSLYEARGDYQLIIEQLTPAGIGALQQKFEALKEKLKHEGLFDDALKQPLPYLPKTIGIVTSPHAAALHDILTTLKRRFKAIPIILYPTDVQGATACTQIADAINTANQRNECDVLIIARGGGSLEDLWSFNEEVVARAIFYSKLPIVTGIGHEIDFTIADFCADLRAPTPTSAAENVTPDSDALLETLLQTNEYLVRLIKLMIDGIHKQLAHLRHCLKGPIHLIHQYYQAIDKRERELFFLVKQQLYHHQKQLHHSEIALSNQNPSLKLNKQKHTLHQLSQRLFQCTKQFVHANTLKLTKLSATLQATSPLATLDRGFSLALTETNQVITRANQLSIGDTFWVKLKKDRLHCQLKDIKK